MHKQSFVCWPSVGPYITGQTNKHTYIYAYIVELIVFPETGVVWRAAADLRFHTAEEHDEHDNEPSPVFAVYAMDKHRVVLRVHKHPQSLGYLLLALPQQKPQLMTGKATRRPHTQPRRVTRRPGEKGPPGGGGRGGGEAYSSCQMSHYWCHVTCHITGWGGQGRPCQSVKLCLLPWLSCSEQGRTDSAKRHG